MHTPIFMNGLWISNDDSKNYAFREGPRDGRPAYQYEILSTAVKMCKARKRCHTAIDGGAHIGLWSLHLCLAFDHVVAFEPMPHNFSALEMNLDHYKCTNVKTYNAGLSDHEGLIKLVKAGGKSFQYKVPIGSEGDIPMPCHKLDTLDLSNVDLLKLDVEGHELEALRGALETIKRCKPVIVIEEKLDPKKRATAMLLSLGMEFAAQKKHDYVYTWR